MWSAAALSILNRAILLTEWSLGSESTNDFLHFSALQLAPNLLLLEQLLNIRKLIEVLQTVRIGERT